MAFLKIFWAESLEEDRIFAAVECLTINSMVPFYNCLDQIFITDPRTLIF